MQIEKHKIVILDYTLKDDSDTVIDSTEGKGDFVYLHGTNNIIPGLEKALEGKTVGDELDVAVAPEQGYGQRNEEMVQVVSKSMFEGTDDMQVGMQFHTQSQEGHELMVTIMEVNGDDITIDGNHPLAGVQLNFSVKVVDIRDATAEEISHGHGAGGHQH